MYLRQKPLYGLRQAIQEMYFHLDGFIYVCYMLLTILIWRNPVLIAPKLYNFYFCGICRQYYHSLGIYLEVKHGLVYFEWCFANSLSNRIKKKFGIHCGSFRRWHQSSWLSDDKKTIEIFQNGLLKLDTRNIGSNVWSQQTLQTCSVRSDFLRSADWFVDEFCIRICLKLIEKIFIWLILWMKQQNSFRIQVYMLFDT